MKKITLLLLASIIASVSTAQVDGTYYFPYFYFDKMSPNGKWLATQAMGAVYIFDREQNGFYEYLPSEDTVTEYYATGLGNCCSSDGIVVGGVNDSTCAYWHDGTWTPLPISEKNEILNMANAITPDGSRIVGTVGLTGLDLYSAQMIEPVYWDRNAEGGYDHYVVLPYPKTDFCGRTPQYVTAINVSDDGKTIVGQVRDWSGWYSYPIIYTQANDGEWSYRTICEGVLFPEGTMFGEWPGEEPAKPDPTLYMNEEQKAAYLAAIDEYNRLNDMYKRGELNYEDVPEIPDPRDYITDQLEKYDADMADYEKILQQYYIDANAFDNNLHSILDGKTFVFNNSFLSGNGKYISSTIKYSKEIDEYSVETINIPVRIEIGDGKDELVEIKAATLMQASSVMNNGRMLTLNPAMAYGRSSYITTDDFGIIPFFDYVESVNYAMYEWVKSFSAFDVLMITGYDEWGGANYEVVEDSLVSGSVHCNSDGTIFTSFMFDEWGYPTGDDYVEQYSYQLDFTQSAGVEPIENNIAQVYVNGNTLYTPSGVDCVAVYDMRGCVVTVIENPSQTMLLDIEQGIYIMKAAAGNDIHIAKVVVE